MSAVASLTDPNDDDAVIAWILARIEAAPDIYMRPLEGAPSSTSSLAEELGIDSIGRIGLLYEIADALECETSEEDEASVAAWQSLGDVIAFVRRSLKAATPAG